MRFTTAAFLVLLVAGTCDAAPPWYSPPKGSAERVQIMDALRAKMASFDPASRDLVFVVNELCVASGNGWLAVFPQSRDGQNRLEPVQARLKRGKSGWVVAALACAEDDCAKGTDAKALRARINPQCE